MRWRAERAQTVPLGTLLKDPSLLVCRSRSNRSVPWGSTFSLGRMGSVRLLQGCLIFLTLEMIFLPNRDRAQSQKCIDEEIEWTWEVRPQHVDSRLPNVLLLSDSINYFPRVSSDLAGIANVYLMASSTSVGDPRLPCQIAEFAAMQGISFAVVHFNNGLHGWGCAELRFETGLSDLLRALSMLPGHARLMWATINTPQTGGNHRCNQSTHRGKERQ